MSSNKTVPMESVASVALAAERQKTGGGLEFPRYFTQEGSNPYNDIAWELRTASITNEKGRFSSSRKGSRFQRAGPKRRRASWSRNIFTDGSALPTGKKACASS